MKLMHFLPFRQAHAQLGRVHVVVDSGAASMSYFHDHGLHAADVARVVEVHDRFSREYPLCI